MITYKNGNLLESDCNVICHQVNCQGVMGSGIAKQIRQKYPKVYKTFKLSERKGYNTLGNIDIIPIDSEDDKYIVNIYSQFHYLPRGIRHTDYEAFRKGLKKLKEIIPLCFIDKNVIKIGFPYNIGCGLGGGDWNIMKQIIEDEFSEEGWEIEIWKR